MGIILMLTLSYLFSSIVCNNVNLFGRPGEGYVIEVMVGKPPQKLNVLIDTGSSNFAIAGTENPSITTHFFKNKSETFVSSNDIVAVVYTQGRWTGILATDVIYFPTLNSVPALKSTIAVITEAENFYMNGSDWQGILGLAYPAISKPNADVVSWIDSLQIKNNDRTMGFSLTLCGMKNFYLNEHYGSFEVLNNVVHEFDGLLTTPVIKEWFYEILLSGIRVNNFRLPIDCKHLNEDKSIVDSGTTNMRLPAPIFAHLVEEISLRARQAGVLLLDEFWTESKISCWPELPNWDNLPSIGIEIVRNAEEYFILEIPGQSYMRQVFAKQGTDNEEPQFCYKFGIEISTSGTILGVVVMEGFQVIFNRTRRNIGFRKSNCGPNVTMSGPFLAELSNDLIEQCSHASVTQFTMLEIAAYIVCTLLIVASAMFAYLLLQWLYYKYFKCRTRGTSLSLSHTSLINENSN